MDDLCSLPDFDKFLDGLFHYFAVVRYADATLEKTVQVLDWLVYGTLMDHHGSGDVEVSMAFQQYAPFAAMGIHHTIPVTRHVRIESPAVLYALHLAAQRSADILQSFLQSHNHLVTHLTMHKQQIRLEVIPQLIHILQPPIRAVNVQLMNQMVSQKKINNFVPTQIVPFPH